MRNEKSKTRFKVLKKIAESIEDSAEQNFTKILSQPVREILPSNKIKRRHDYSELPYSDRAWINKARNFISNKEHTICDVFGDNCKIKSTDSKLKNNQFFLQAVECFKHLTDWGVEYMEDQNKYWQNAFSDISFTDHRTEEFQKIFQLAFETAVSQLAFENKKPAQYRPAQENLMSESDLSNSDLPKIKSFYEKIQELAGPNFDHLTSKVTNADFEGTKQLISIVNSLSEQGKKYLHDQTAYQGKSFNPATKSYIRRVVEKAGGPLADSSVTPEFLNEYKKYHNLK